MAGVCCTLVFGLGLVSSAIGQQRSETDRSLGPSSVIDSRIFERDNRLARQSTPSTPVRTTVRDPLNMRLLPPADEGSFPYPQYLDDDRAGVAFASNAGLPDGFAPWWRTGVTQQQRQAGAVYPVNLDALVVSALAYSSFVRAISDDVLIHETNVLEAEAAFDLHNYVESKFDRDSDPIGSVLDTGAGGPPRLRQLDWRFSAGFRKRTPLGGSWDISQQIGMRDSNSRFFLPKQQGNARLALSFSQPLLNGAGRAYNRAYVLLADIETRVARDRTAKAIQDHLVRITETYWGLYLQRAVLLQQKRHLQRARRLLDELDSRRDVDAVESQILRARAAVAARNSDLVKAAARVREREAALRALTNSPALRENPYQELVPLDIPFALPVELSLRQALVTALEHRQEVDAAVKEIRAASVRLNMSRNELLPALDLVLETYVQGLDADYDIGQSFVEQFSVGEPGYSAGLVFEVPFGRRAARAKYTRRRLQLRQLAARFDETVQTLMSEVEVAVREVGANYSSMIGKHGSLLAAEAEVAYSTRRWQLLAGDDRAGSMMIDDLLDAQDRLATEELGYAQAQHDYTLSLTHLKQATGTLLETEQVDSIRYCQEGLPALQYEKRAGAPTPGAVLR